MLRSNLMRLVACILILAGMLPLMGSTIIDPAKISDSGAEYKTGEVVTGSFTKTVAGGGVMYYPKKYQIKCETYNARVKSISVGRSDKLEEGQEIGVLYTESSRADLALLRQRLENAQESLEEMDRVLDDKILALQSSAASASDPLDSEMLRLRISRAAIEYEKNRFVLEKEISDLKERISEEEEKLKDTPVYSPVTGKIEAYSYLNEGDSVAYGTVILRVYETAVYLIRVEDDNNRWHYGMDVTVAYGPRNNRKEAAGRVVSADNVLPYNKKTGYSYIALDEFIDPEDLSSINLSATYLSLDNVLLAPKKAVSLQKGKNLVSILEGSSVAQRYVYTPMYNSDWYLVLQGLTDGQVLILD